MDFTTIMLAHDELVRWREYEEEVDYFSDDTDDLTDAIEALLAVVAKRKK